MAKRSHQFLKWLKFTIGVFLLPMCWGFSKSLWLVIKASGGADLVWVPLLSGFLCWIIVYSLLPKPMLAYVFGHELTHALWTWAFGGKVNKFKATSSGGHVVITKNNFLITLAPYFFPLYAILLAVVYYSGHLIWDWSGYIWLLHFALGLAYAFHITMTRHILRTSQSDITENGYLFSFVIILIGNLLVLLVGIPLLTSSVSIFSTARWMWESASGAYIWIGNWLLFLVERMKMG